MSYDIPESIPQGSDGAQEAENRRIEEIADEISRLCRVYEAQLSNGEVDVNPFEVEQRVAEQLAKSEGFWRVRDLGSFAPQCADRQGRRYLCRFSRILVLPFFLPN